MVGLFLFVLGGILILGGLYGAVRDAYAGPVEQLTRQEATVLEGMFCLTGLVLLVVAHYI